MLTDESNSSNESNHQKSYDDEILLTDIIEFIKNSWKLIISMAFIVLIVGIIFLLFVSKQYEALAQIQIAQIGPKGSSKDYFNPEGSNIEDPALLIARFKLPSTYTSSEIDACGLKNTGDADESLVDFVKISPLKGTTSVVEMRVRNTSVNLANLCLLAILERVRETQNEIKEPFLNVARLRLDNAKKKLATIKNILERADKSGNALSASYLSARDDSKSLQEDISLLEDFIVSGEIRGTRLVSPIYVSDRPVFPNRRLTLIFSFLIGLISGVIIALARKYKNF